SEHRRTARTRGEPPAIRTCAGELPHAVAGLVGVELSFREKVSPNLALVRVGAYKSNDSRNAQRAQNPVRRPRSGRGLVRSISAGQREDRDRRSDQESTGLIGRPRGGA